MTWLLWLVIAILWTVVCLAAGYARGKQEKVDEKTKLVEGDYYPVSGPPGAVGATGTKGEPGPTGPPGPEADVLGTILPNGMSLSEWIIAADTRFTRVERKAGMSV